jgi:exodeoxyribonuclease VII large subunit
LDSHSLLEFNQLIKSILDKNLEKSYWIIAEIGELNVNQKGHCYLDLIEKQDNYIVAKNRATIWSYTFSKLNNWFADRTGTPLKSGMNVLVNASVQYHEVYGFSLNIKDVDPNFTIGERERKKQETIKKLEAEGIIDMNKSVVLPLVPQRIAVISSETAAGYGDFVNQLETNSYGYSVAFTLFKSTMQGDQAVESILQSLHRIYDQEDDFDLVAIIRGGGAQTDLDCFDDYELCSHLSQFPLPIITGIGHERDNTITDMVANTRMKTPTAVAEFVISGLLDYDAKINSLYERVFLRATEIIREQEDRLNNISHGISMLGQQKIHRSELKLNNIENSIKILPMHIIERNLNKLNVFEKTILASNPKKILERGFTVTKINGKFVTNSKEPNSGDIVETTTKDTKFESIVQ